MKNVIIFLFAATFFYSCKNAVKSNGQFEEANFIGKYVLPLTSIKNPPMSDSLDDMIVYETADTMVKAYISDATLIRQFCFTFNANYLKRYIDSVKSPIIEFFLAEDTFANNKQLHLIAAMIDSTGENSYFNFKNKFYALQSCPTKFNIRCDTSGTQNITVGSFYSEGMSAAGGHVLIDQYQKIMTKNATANWLYNANDIENYIISARRIQYLQATLGLNGSKVDLVLFGIDSSGNQMYFSYDKKSCVLENANPCPICEVSTMTGLSKPQ